MDEILVSRVLDSRDSSGDLKFQDILLLIDALSLDNAAKKWFKINLGPIQKMV